MKKGAEKLLKALPSIDWILENGAISGFINEVSRGGVVEIARQVVSDFREEILNGRVSGEGVEGIRSLVLEEVKKRLESVSGLKQVRVINATGVILHTNLGRAPLSRRVRDAIVKAADGYVDLEMDLEEGTRTDRTRRVRKLLSLLSGSEDALIINNNAAAVFLAVKTLSKGGGVAVSRGELVEIGGSFRLPEILASAAERVFEVGTTNKTHLEDYIEALDAGANFLLKVHTSNYRIVGFTDDVSLSELVKLGQSRGVPVMYDQGSGVLYPFSSLGIEGEDCIDEILATGVDLVSFSTDKVLGGPQGGAILGKRELIKKLKKNHLSRALRVDKLTLAGLEEVLLQYWEGDFEGIPSLRMIKIGYSVLENRARKLVERLSQTDLDVKIDVVEGTSSIGGGSYPTNPLRSPIIQINLPENLSTKLVRLLRTGRPSLLVRIKGNSIFIDLRTVFEEEEDVLFDILTGALKKVYEEE